MPANDRSGEVQGVVLDTNAVLDWLVFRDPAMQHWIQAIESGRLHWLVCSGMRDELLRTLDYTPLARWQPDHGQVLATFDRWSVGCPTPNTRTPPGLICSDPDDQVFLDLGLAQKARWLVTHDRALLRLARLARGHGLLVVKPAIGATELKDNREWAGACR